MLGAMGKTGDRNAVVDAHGKVFGVNALRVVDISAFPFLPPGHTQANVCKYNIVKRFIANCFWFDVGLTLNCFDRYACGKIGR